MIIILLLWFDVFQIPTQKGRAPLAAAVPDLCLSSSLEGASFEGVPVILNNGKDKLKVGFKIGPMPVHMDHLKAVNFSVCLQFVIQEAFRCINIEKMFFVQ